MTYDNSVHYTYTFSGLLSTAGNNSMVWDASSNRISFTSSTDQSHPYTFVYDVTAGIPAVIAELHDGTSVYYVREPNGALLARISGETTQYYQFDDLGSTLYLTGTGGTVTDTYAYDAWGNVTNHTGSTNQPHQYVGQLGYYTHYQDENLRLLQLGVRFYTPQIGRFTQADPIRHGLNWYAYVADAPLTSVDPSGLRFWGWGRGQLMVGPSCRDVVGFIGYTPENRGGILPPRIRRDNWYAVDAAYFCCDRDNKDPAQRWVSVKIPDWTLCRVTCRRQSAGGCATIEMHIDCETSNLSGSHHPTRNDPAFPPPTHRPGLPSGVKKVVCKFTGV